MNPIVMYPVAAIVLLLVGAALHRWLSPGNAGAAAVAKVKEEVQSGAVKDFAAIFGMYADTTDEDSQIRTANRAIAAANHSKVVKAQQLQAMAQLLLHEAQQAAQALPVATS